MGTFEWVGKSRRVKPDGLYEIVVREPGVKPAIRAHADSVGAKASAVLAANRDTGASYIEVNSGDVVDAFVELVDPAAMSIEFGHIHRWKDREGTVQSKFVQGVAPLRKAIGRG